MVRGNKCGLISLPNGENENTLREMGCGGGNVCVFLCIFQG